MISPIKHYDLVGEARARCFISYILNVPHAVYFFLPLQLVLYVTAKDLFLHKYLLTYLFEAIVEWTGSGVQTTKSMFKS